MTCERPNIVLICVDQWRGDCLSAAEHPVVRTPYLDELAGRGVRFDRAYTAVPSCVAARAALFTGLSQEHHGRVGYRDGVAWDYAVTLAGEFSRHGYQTRAIGKLHVYPDRNRVGFDEVALHDGFVHFSRRGRRDPRFHDDYLSWLREQPGSSASTDYYEHGLNCNSVVARPWDRPERLHPSNWIVHEAIDFLYRRDPTAPYFLYLSFHRPHPPYDPPAWAFEQYLSAPPHEPPVGDWAEMLEPWRNDTDPDATVAVYDPATVKRARAGYFGHMSHIDQQINRFLESLVEFGEADNTWICFTADHGEMLGDHHVWRKSLPFEGSAHIPLLLSGPPGQLREGTVVSELVELRDVMPTLLSAAGLPVPDGLDGRSLLTLGGERPTEWRDHLHGEHTALGQSVQWIVTGNRKYVWFSADGRELLFDLATDPQERHNQSGSPAHAEDLARLRGLLVAALRDRPEGFVCGDSLVPGRPVDPVLPVVAELATRGGVGNVVR